MLACVFIFFWVGGGGGIPWNLKGLDGSSLGVRIGLGSTIWGMFKLLVFFIYLNGEHEGAPTISTVASLAGQLTISSMVILYFGSKWRTLDRNALATSGSPAVS